MADPMTKKMSEASQKMNKTNPKKGERYRCKKCGMEVQLNSDCRCTEQEWHVHFQCCGQELAKV
jgi:hypothetical protein